MMKTLHWVNVLLLVMGIFGDLGVALKTGTKADQDSDGDDSNDENPGSQEETNAPDNDSSSSGGSVGGALDLAGLQNSLKEGGVDGLNNMLKSFAATMNSAGSVKGANMHMAKDADGHDMYDFRDMEASSTPIPAHAQGAQTLPLTPPLQAMPLQSKVSPRVEKREAETRSSDVASVSFNDKKSQDLSSGDVPVAVALPLHATTKGMPLPSIWDSHEQKANAKLPPADSSQKKGSKAQVVLEQPIPPPKFETTAVSERTAAPPVAKPAVSRSTKRSFPPSSTATSSTATGSSIAKLSSSLDEVRHSVDTLLTLALRKQDEAPSADQKQVVMELPFQNQLMAERVGALEQENSKLERMLQVQAGRLEAMESQQQDENRELGQVLHENIRLQVQLDKKNRLKMRSRAFLHSGSRKITKKLADHHIQTYYHRRNNSAGQKH